jgi:hypothetical protein
MQYKSSDMKNITIFYQGGSGGFALYYYLLLSGNYQLSIDATQDQIQNQFPSSLKHTPTKWKYTEHWPDNPTLKKSNEPCVFLICNPLFDSNMLEANLWISQNTHKILLHTNIHLQLRLAYDKQAYWFTDISRQHFQAPADNKKYLRQILNSAKDSHDPQISKISQVFRPNQLVLLEDFVRSQQIEGFDSTPNQREFLNRWLDLQTDKIKHMIKSTNSRV